MSKCTCNQKIHNRFEGFTINSLFKSDPTRTLTLRNQFVADMVRRFKKIRMDIDKSVRVNDCFGLLQPSHSINALEAIPPRAFAFQRDSEKVNSFMEWLEKQVGDNVLEIYPGQQIGTAVEQAWTNKYVQTAYQKGVIRARQELRNSGYPVPLKDDPFAGISAAFNQPFHVDRMGLLFTRSYRDLKGITDAMDGQISRILSQGIADGKHPRELAKQLVKTISGPVGGLEITDTLGRFVPAERRAILLARTEVIRAHHVATIQEYKNWGAVGVRVQAEWSTAGDGRVCKFCKEAAKKDNGFGPGIYTLAQIEKLIPLHPQCRCIALPVDITEAQELIELIEIQKAA